MATLLVYDERLGGDAPWKQVNSTCVVNDSHSMESIVNWVRKKCGKYEGRETLYLMAHGNSGFIQLGKEGLSSENYTTWQPLAGKLSQIIVLACGTGGGNAGYWFCSRLAATTKAYVTAAESTQIYFYIPLGIMPTNFGEWEGTINTWDDTGTWAGRYVEPSISYSHIQI
jgi:Domain of unknown function (DUF4347)